MVSLGTTIGLRELIWGHLGSFGTVLAPKMPPRSPPRNPKGPFWDQKASRRGPKMRVWDPQLSKKGVSEGPRLSKCEVWVPKKLGPKWGPEPPAFLRGVQKSRSTNYVIYVYLKNAKRKHSVLTMSAKGPLRKTCIFNGLRKAQNGIPAL